MDVEGGGVMQHQQEEYILTYEDRIKIRNRLKNDDQHINAMFIDMIISSHRILPDLPNGYIITEEQMQDLHAMLHIMYEQRGVEILQRVHSHPYPAKSEPTTNNSTKSTKLVVAQTSEEELREKVLDGFLRWVKPECVKELVRMYKAELRKPGEQR